MSVEAQLRRAVSARAVQVFTVAETRMLADLDQAVPVKSGQLKRSRRSSARYGATSASVTVEYPPESRPGGGVVDVATFTDKGTRPHVIVRRRKKALSFTVGGRVIFARKVHHPGTKGTRWWTNQTTATKWRDYLMRATR